MNSVYVDKDKKRLCGIKRKKRTQPFNMESKHFHEHYEIYYLISGERHIFVKDRTYTIRSGDIVLIEAHELHRTTAARTAEHDRVVAHFHKKLLDPHLPNVRELLLRPFQQATKVIHLTEEQRHIVEHLLFTMLAETDKRHPGYQWYTQTLITHLLFFVQRMTAHIGKADEAETSIDPLHRKIYEAVVFINDHYSQTITLQMISEKFFLSPSYFSRKFRAVTGFTFIEYVNHVRVKEAQKLLSETNLKIIDISERVGFDNPTHFGRIFKQVMRMSPIQYRKH